MKCRAPFQHGAPGSPQGVGGLFSHSSFRKGFTLLEMCMVLFIIALLATVAIPAVQSAYDEQTIRSDSHELALMVKTAMLQSADQHRAYAIDLSPTTMTLHPADQPGGDDSSAASASSDSDDSNATADDVVITQDINKSNKLQMPDPDKPNAWKGISNVTWLFQPGELCPAPRVRLARAGGWIEMDFNPLTGNVENETAYFP